MNEAPNQVRLLASWRVRQGATIVGGAVNLGLEEAADRGRKAYVRAEVTDVLGHGDWHGELIAIRINPIEALSEIEDPGAIPEAEADIRTRNGDRPVR